MSPLQAAKEHCANYQTDGSCLGVYYNRDLSVAKCIPLPRCLLHEPIQRCPYFEEIVMPMKLEGSNRLAQEKKRQSFDEGVDQYRMAVGFQAIKRRCALCRQKDTASKRSQYCPTCRDVRSRESHRRRKARYREAKRTVHGSACVNRSKYCRPSEDRSARTPRTSVIKFRLRGVLSAQHIVACRRQSIER